MFSLTHWTILHSFKPNISMGSCLSEPTGKKLKVAWWKACLYWLIGWKGSNLHRNRGEWQETRLRQTFVLHPSLSVPFNTRLWVPQWNISLHGIIIMNGLCSVSVSLMEFTESLLLLSFLLLHRRAANPIHFHSYPSDIRFPSLPSIFINLPARSIPLLYDLITVKETFPFSKHIWLQAQMCFWLKE